MTLLTVRGASGDLMSEKSLLVDCLKFGCNLADAVTELRSAESSWPPTAIGWDLKLLAVASDDLCRKGLWLYR